MEVFEKEEKCFLVDAAAFAKQGCVGSNEAATSLARSALRNDHGTGKRFSLEAGRTIGGYVAVPGPDCAARNPKVAAAAAWDFEAGIRLRDPTRKLLFTFMEDETTVMKTRGDTVPVTLIVQAKPGVDRAPFAPDLYGTWAMRRLLMSQPEARARVPTGTRGRAPLRSGELRAQRPPGFETFDFLSPECPWKVRVGANSPNL